MDETQNPLLKNGSLEVSLLPIVYSLLAGQDNGSYKMRIRTCYSTAPSPIPALMLLKSVCPTRFPTV